MYAASIEEKVGGFNLLAQVYGTVIGTDKQNIFVNGVGANLTIGNAGVINTDVFSSEDAFRRRVEPRIGTQINGIRSEGLDQLVCFKDKGVLRGRLIVDNGIPDISWTFVTKEDGCATVNGVCQDDEGWFYFAGYYSIYRTREGVLQDLIDTTSPNYIGNAPKNNDWLNTYKAMSNTLKESCTIWYNAKTKGIYFCFNNQSAPQTTTQYVWHFGYGWRQISFGKQYDTDAARYQTEHFPKWITRKQDGTIFAMVDKIGNFVATKLIQFNNSVFTDDTISIIPQFLIDGFVVARRENGESDLNKNFYLDKIVIDKTISTATSGTLDVIEYIDGSLVKTFSNVDKTNTSLLLNSGYNSTKTGLKLGLSYNTNSTSKEYLSSGSQFTINAIRIFCELTPNALKF